MQSGERAGKSGDVIRDHAVTERRIALQILVGIDQYFRDLRRQPLQHPLDHRPAAEKLQALVHAAHAAALPAGEDDAGD
jgi:hypothetical protein